MFWTFHTLATMCNYWQLLPFTPYLFLLASVIDGLKLETFLCLSWLYLISHNIQFILLTQNLSLVVNLRQALNGLKQDVSWEFSEIWQCRELEFLKLEAQESFPSLMYISIIIEYFSQELLLNFPKWLLSSKGIIIGSFFFFVLTKLILKDNSLSSVCDFCTSMV